MTRTPQHLSNLLKYTLKPEQTLPSAGQQRFYCFQRLYFATCVPLGCEVKNEGLEPAGCFVLQQTGQLGTQPLLPLLGKAARPRGVPNSPRGDGNLEEHRTAEGEFPISCFLLTSRWDGEPPRWVGEECYGRTTAQGYMGQRGECSRILKAEGRRER